MPAVGVAIPGAIRPRSVYRAPASGVFNLAQVNKWPTSVRLGVGRGSTITSIGDGTSNTVMFSEVVPFTEPLNAASKRSPFGTNNDVRGTVIMPAAAATCSSRTRRRIVRRKTFCFACDPRIPPDYPNKLSCTQNQTDGNTWAAARSKHTGGVNAAFADGSVEFVRDSVDPQAWKAVGTKNGGEVLGLD